MKRNLKKALSVVLAASLMATSSAFTVLAAGEEIPPESVSLMPADADAVTGGTATMENGSLTLDRQVMPTPPSPGKSIRM